MTVLTDSHATGSSIKFLVERRQGSYPCMRLLSMREPTHVKLAKL